MKKLERSSAGHRKTDNVLALVALEPALKSIALAYGRSRYGSLKAYVTHLLKKDLSEHFELPDELETVAKKLGVKPRRKLPEAQ